MNTELQQRIIKQATRMFLCNGIKSVTMDMIASQLGISKRTLYENFKKKNELLLACLESQEMERRARLEVYFANRKNVIDLLLNVYEDILRFMRNTSPMFLWIWNDIIRELMISMRMIRNAINKLRSIY